MYIISATAQNKPGVLAKTSNLLRRKLFNIMSLTAGKTHIPDISKFTIVFDGPRSEAVKAQLMIQKIVEVLDTQILNEVDFVVREIVLARLNITNEEDFERLIKAEDGIYIRELSRSGTEALVEIVDTTQGVDDFLQILIEEKVEIVDWTRSGVIAM